VTVAGLVGGGLLIALALAFVVGPRASSSPDGLERVAMDEGFADAAQDSATADSPLAEYAVRGVDHEGMSTGLAGVIGVSVTFAVGSALFLLLRALHRRSTRAAT
jgi:hypothetical protein